MYNVVLVDDEQLVLEALQQLIPWSDLEMQITGCFKNGLAALQYLEENHADIIVTDIKMPHMSGLEMAEKLRKQNESLKIIFMSGYEDFHYAQKAIEMNASSYILKPADEGLLEELLGKLKQELDEERKKVQIQDRLNDTLPIVKHELISQWLRGDNISHTLSSLSWYDVKWRGKLGCVAIVEFDDVAWRLEDENPLYDMLHAKMNEIRKWAESGKRCYSAEVGGHRIALLFDRLERLPLPDLSALSNAIKENSPFTVTIGVGQLVEHEWQIPNSFIQAQKAVRAKMFTGKNRVITQEHLQEEANHGSDDLESRFDVLLAATANYDLVQIHDCLKDLFSYIQTIKNKITVANFSVYVLSKVEHYLQSMKIDIYQVLGIEFQNLDIFHRMETIEDIERWLRKKIFQISEHIHWQKQKPNHRLVLEIDQYMEAHLDSSITLREVADHFAFSPNYLGFLYKQETGINFSAAVTEKRLEKAKQLLAETMLKVYEVADQVGYKNLTYFGRHFKNHFGVSPIEYRKQISQG